jgi:hypothetical protein
MMAAATWANYPVANAWISQIVWDHFDYSQDKKWYREVGYPILKGSAEFWLSQLVEDKYFNDSTLVVNPCNSPEHGPTVSTSGIWKAAQIIVHRIPTTDTDVLKRNRPSAAPNTSNSSGNSFTTSSTAGRHRWIPM